MAAPVFSDTFEVRAVNPDKKVFDRVDRLVAHAETYDCDVVIDVNCELWRVRVGEKFQLQLATSLTGKEEDGIYKPSDEPSLLDSVSRRALPPRFGLRALPSYAQGC